MSRSELLRQGALAVLEAEEVATADARLQEAYRRQPQDPALVDAGREIANGRFPNLNLKTGEVTVASRDVQMNGIPMHRGLGPHVRGESDRIRGLGTLGAPSTFGHGGVGSSYSWADPESGVSFTYLTNFVSPDPWHSARLDRVANLVHAAID